MTRLVTMVLILAAAWGCKDAQTLPAGADAVVAAHMPAAPPPGGQMGVPEIRMVGEQARAMTIHEGAYDTIGETIGALYSWAGSHGLRPTGAPTMVYHKHPENVATPAQYVTSVSIPITLPEGKQPASAGYWIDMDFGYRIAVQLEQGAPAEVSKQYAKLAAWIAKQGLVVASPPSMISLDNPATTAPEKQRHELFFIVGDPAQGERGQTARAAAADFFKACKEENWDVASNYDPQLSENLKHTLGGLEVLEVGLAIGKFSQYPGLHIPYRVKLKSGDIKEHYLALRDDLPDRGWTVDGGL
jgi:DNA gyrase inhibitor GyrI